MDRITKRSRIGVCASAVTAERNATSTSVAETQICRRSRWNLMLFPFWLHVQTCAVGSTACRSVGETSRETQGPFAMTNEPTPFDGNGDSPNGFRLNWLTPSLTSLCAPRSILELPARQRPDDRRARNGKLLHQLGLGWQAIPWTVLARPDFLP